jgi:hypothetical protein
MRCDFCGCRFDPEDLQQGCASCPIVNNCVRLSCPNCGYPLTPETRLGRWLKDFRLPRFTLFRRANDESPSH